MLWNDCSNIFAQPTPTTSKNHSPFPPPASQKKKNRPLGLSALDQVPITLQVLSIPLSARRRD